MLLDLKSVTAVGLTLVASLSTLVVAPVVKAHLDQIWHDGTSPRGLFSTMQAI